MFFKEFVLSCGGKSNINGNFPRTFAFYPFEVVFFCKVFCGFSVYYPKVFDVSEFFAVDAIGIINITMFVSDGNNFAAEFVYFFNSISTNITITGNSNGFAFEGVAVSLHHFIEEVNKAITGSFGTDQGTTEGHPFAGENAGEFVGKAFVLTEHIADFTSTGTDVTGGNVEVGTDVAIQFGHEGLAETHDFAIGFAATIKVGTTFTAAHGKGGKAVFEYLLESKEFQHTEVNGGMKTKAAFVGPDGAVHLNAVAAVDLNFVVIIYPGDAEHHNSFGFSDSLKDFCFFIFRMFIDIRNQGCCNLFHGLVKLGFAGVFSFDFFHKAL